MANAVGEKDVIAALNKFVARTKGNTQKGVLKALLYVKKQAIPLTPVELGDLRKNYDISVVKTFKGVSGRIENNSEYAAAQHENLEFNHPRGGEAKFLEKAVSRNVVQIASIVKEAAKV